MKKPLSKTKKDEDWRPDLTGGKEKGITYEVVQHGPRSFLITEKKEGHPNFHKQYTSEFNPLEEDL